MEVSVWFKIDNEVAANAGEASLIGGILSDVALRVKDGEFNGTISIGEDVVGSFSTNP